MPAKEKNKKMERGVGETDTFYQNDEKRGLTL
jgi:hypothetical protein